MTTSQPDRRMEELAMRIAVNGFATCAVGYGRCAEPGCCAPASRHPWAYTIGLVEEGLPEVVVMGLDLRKVGHALNWVGGHMLDEGPLPVDAAFDLDGVKAKLVDVPPQWFRRDPSRMAMWVQHYGRVHGTPRVVQLMWPDAAGRFPDDPLFDRVLLRQQPSLPADPYRYPKPYTPRTTSRHSKRRR